MSPLYIYMDLHNALSPEQLDEQQDSSLSPCACSRRYSDNCLFIPLISAESVERCGLTSARALKFLTAAISYDANPRPICGSILNFDGPTGPSRLARTDPLAQRAPACHLRHLEARLC